MVHETLKEFLESNLPSSGKKSSDKIILGVSDKILASSIKSELNVDCQVDEVVSEIIRGIRLFAPKLFKQLKDGDLDRAQLGLGHSYSRAKVKFNVHRVDNMIIQAIALLDQIDKDMNTFSMRIREWYSWHFPELSRLVPDQLIFAKLVLAIPDRTKLSDTDLEKLSGIIGSSNNGSMDPEALSNLILEASRSSMGTDVSPIDMINIRNFASRVVSMANYRHSLHTYLVEKMDIVAPNLAALIGEIVGARLIAHAGSLTNLSKAPASTVQILGAEKALFRALKTKGKTPKYGLLYHSTFIGKASQKNKGRISRYLANKCSIASRIDCFSDEPSNNFGTAMKGQVEERLKFYETGAIPSKNAEVMSKVIKTLKRKESPESAKPEKSKKAKVEGLEKKEKKDEKEKNDKKAKKEKEMEKKDEKEKNDKKAKKEKDDEKEKKLKKKEKSK
jgi:nucleolar protein 56